jgi:hypothetical protein
VLALSSAATAGAGGCSAAGAAVVSDIRTASASARSSEDLNPNKGCSSIHWFFSAVDEDANDFSSRKNPISSPKARATSSTLGRSASGKGFDE